MIKACEIQIMHMGWCQEQIYQAIEMENHKKFWMHENVEIITKDGKKRSGKIHYINDHSINISPICRYNEAIPFEIIEEIKKISH